MSLQTIGVLIAYLLGTQNTATHPEAWKAVHPNTVAVAAAGVRDSIGPGFKDLETDHRMHQYTYQFHGRAMYQGKPCPQANVIVRLLSPSENQTQTLLTDENGFYSAEFHIVSRRNAPIDYWMQAYTPDSRRADLEGRKIAMREDETMVVENQFSLLPS